MVGIEVAFGATLVAEMLGEMVDPAIGFAEFGSSGVVQGFWCPAIGHRDLRLSFARSAGRVRARIRPKGGF